MSQYCKQTMVVIIGYKFLTPWVGILKAEVEPLLEEFRDVFEGIGKLEEQYIIVTDPSVTPVFPPRRVPVAPGET